MASNLFISDRAASTCVNAVGRQLNSGFIDIYAGPQPSDANTDTSGSNYVLAELTFSSVAGSAVGSTWTTNPINATTCTSTGIATFYRAYTSSRAAVMDGSVSTSGADFNLNTNNFRQGIRVSIT